MDYKIIVLKPDRDRHVRNRHPWIMRGAIQEFPEFENGSFLAVQSASGEHLGYGYFNIDQSIAGRMVNFDHGDPLAAIRNNLQNAANLRKTIFTSNTNCLRLVNGEGDYLPGLIVDQYDSVLVLQINTLGMEKLKTIILEFLTEHIRPSAIYEKANSQTRKKEGLSPISQWIYGQPVEPVVVLENGLKFEVQFSDSQKTGFFLDQREMRNAVKNYADNRTVLNCFSYTGGFTVYALAGGAISADSIDSSEIVIAGARQNLKLNNFDENINSLYQEDVFKFLQRPLPKPYDFIILDPPAFAKRANDVNNAKRGYRELNRAAMQKLPKGGLLLTSSCSAHIDKQLFQTIVFQAAKDAKRNVKILSFHSLAPDHPLSLYYPEGDYLKSLLLYLD